MKFKAFLLVGLLLFIVIPAMSNFNKLTSLDWQMQVPKFNPMAYGAVGNGTTDDTHALQQCFQDAYSNKESIVEITSGNYKITQPIRVIANENLSIIIRGQSKNNRPLIFSDNFINILEVQGVASTPIGSVEIADLQIRGNNPPWSPSHPYYNNKDCRIGIHISNKAYVNINNVDIQNIFGQGLNIVNDLYDKCPLEKRCKMVNITNCHILNCWAQNPLRENYDRYGDGIYISNVSAGIISTNIVNNDLYVTKQLGRAGITLEYETEHITIVNNQINGYDRDIHVEADFGSDSIINNKLTGSDMGLLIYAEADTRKKGGPIYVIGNYFSNENMPRNTDLHRIRMDRGLLSFFTNGNVRPGSIVRGNVFKISSNYSFENNKNIILFGRSANTSYVKNSYISNLDRSKVAVYQYYDSGKVDSNIYNNVDLYIKTSQPSGGASKRLLKNSAQVHFF